MTIKETVRVLKNMKKFFNDEGIDNYYRFELDDNEAIDKAIEILEQAEVMKDIDIEVDPIRRISI